MTYRTIKSAHNALKLDAGYDPFLFGGVQAANGTVYRRATRQALAAIGYRVDPGRSNKTNQKGKQ